MNERKSAYRPVDLLWLALGSISYVFIGWRWSMPIAAWIAPIFFIRFFRNQDRWYKALIAFPLIALAGFINKTGAWDLDLIVEIALCVLLPLPLMAALYMDRYFARKLKGPLATLVYPAVYVALDYAVSLWPVLGTITSIANTQFELTPLAQLASVIGIWGISFLICWTTSIVNTLWENHFDLRQVVRPVAIYAACLSLVLVFGAGRLALARPAAETVRVGSITVPHPRDYWSEIIDQGTPRELAHRYEAEIAALDEKLFAESEKAVQGGAKIVFWSEGNGVLYEEEEAAFMQRARAFAQEHQVYFAPALLVLHYGQTSSDNKLVMIEPSGEVAFSYTKTISWYATDSDGVLRSVDTPYGRISAAICFDFDFPTFIRQAAHQGVDIMLDPSFDSAGIKPYHSYVSLFRALEGGFSIVRQVNQGTSIAVDYQGNVLAYQDYFRTADRTMFADVPTHGVTTVYGVLGDWFAYADLAFVAGLVVWAVYCGFAGRSRRHAEAERRGEPLVPGRTP